MNRILFVDIRNAIRSPIAEAWFNHRAGGCGVASSCGTMPANAKDPRVTQVLREAGLAVPGRGPRPISQRSLTRADRIVLMGPDIDPAALAPAYIWQFQEPVDGSLVQLGALRDEIGLQVEKLVDEIRLQDLDIIQTQVEWQALLECILR